MNGVFAQDGLCDGWMNQRGARVNNLNNYISSLHMLHCIFINLSHLPRKANKIEPNKATASAEAAVAAASSDSSQPTNFLFSSLLHFTLYERSIICRAQLRILHGISDIFGPELLQLHSNTFITAWHTIYMTLSTINWLWLYDVHCALDTYCIYRIDMFVEWIMWLCVLKCMKNSMEFMQTQRFPTSLPDSHTYCPVRTLE